LFHVLTRLFDPPPGTVLLRGQDVLAVTPRVLRSELGYALQQVHLFSDTIRANLTFGMEREVSDAELAEAAKAAQILDEILSFKDQWNTEIGEKGVRLSGGQKQRLALARLFLRKPRILLLDDVLSAVDHRTEKALIEHIFSTGCAMLVASHRGSALKRCDEVLILAEGRIADRGPYDQIVSRHPELRTELAE
jgi:ATP-binding cassette subfamily B protein